MSGQAKKEDKMSIKDLEELEEDITNFIELFADQPNELEDMNPLFAHINLVKALNKITPILKDIYEELAQKEDIMTLSEIKEVRNLNVNNNR